MRNGFRSETVKNERGTSLLELVVTLGLTAVVSGTAVSQMMGTRTNREYEAKHFVSHLRLCRAQAMSRGMHCKVSTPTTGSYQVQTLSPDGGGGWVVASSRDIDFGSDVTFRDDQGAPTTFTVEYDSRGMMTSHTAVLTLELHSSSTDETRHAELWPSGQVLTPSG